MTSKNEAISSSEDSMRLDLALVSRGLMETRAQAQAAIKAGKVIVDGNAISKPSFKVEAGQEITAEKAHPYVSRGGLKLAHALDVFKIDAKNKIALDIGASTGGFTDVLLRSGARKIYAVDVGKDQLHSSLTGDTRVISYEGMDARKLDRNIIQEAPDIIVCDASFISLTKLLRTPLKLATPKADLIALFKPQFEVGKENIGKGGIVSNKGAVSKAREQFDRWLDGVEWQIEKSCASPISGGDGNREYLIHARRVKQGWTP